MKLPNMVSLFRGNLLQKQLDFKGFRSLQWKLSHFLSSTQPSTQPSTPENVGGDILSNSLKHHDYFGVAKLFTVEDLFKARVHLGHKEGSLCNYMKPYIFGSRLGHFIIDLDQTASLLRDALNFTSHIAFRGGIILFIGRGTQHQILVEKAADECREYSHTRPYDSALLPNATKYFGCVTRLPDLMIFIRTMTDVLAEHQAVVDSARMLIPSVGIVDTNCDPRLIAYPVPGNDDSYSSIRLYCKLFKEAVLLGKEKRKELLLDSQSNL